MIKVRGTLGSGWVGGGGHWKTWQGPLDTPFASADSARSAHRLTIGVHGLADELTVNVLSSCRYGALEVLVGH